MLKMVQPAAARQAETTYCCHAPFKLLIARNSTMYQHLQQI